MRKIFFAFSLASVAAALVFAAEESKSTATSTTEHRVMKPADLKWGEGASRIASQR
jgi:hypothetical protein